MPSAAVQSLNALSFKVSQKHWTLRASESESLRPVPTLHQYWLQGARSTGNSDTSISRRSGSTSKERGSWNCSSKFSRAPMTMETQSLVCRARDQPTQETCVPLLSSSPTPRADSNHRDTVHPPSHSPPTGQTAKSYR